MAKLTISLAGDKDNITLPGGPPHYGLPNGELDPIKKPPRYVFDPPTLNPPTEDTWGWPKALDKHDRNDITDVVKMEKKFDEYTLNSEFIKNLHLEWLTAYNGWSNRMDRINGAAQLVDKTLEVLLPEAPQDMGDGEKWVDRLGWMSSLLAGTGGMAHKYYKYRKALKSVGPIVPVLSRREITRLTNLRNKAKKGIGFEVVMFAIGAYGAINEGIERANFLMEKMNEYHDWFDDTLNATATMRDETINNIFPRLNDLADALGVLVKGDPNQTYCNVIDTLEDLANSLAEYEAQYRIATRMICKGQDVFNDAQIVLATNLDLQAIQDRRSEIALDQSICDRFG